jgi:hypothetical protein
MQYLGIHHIVFTLWNPTSLQCLLQYETVNSSRMITDGCKIIVVLGKMCNDKTKPLNCKIKIMK